MTVEEIFKDLATHMIQGMMLHQELANYYDFLNLKGYKKCHQYHYLDESCGYRKLYHYYVEHFNKLIEKENIQSDDFIPRLWYKHIKEQVDAQLKRQSIQNAIRHWIEWEKQTKELYQVHYKQLIDLNEVAAAMFLKEYIYDVTEELKYAEEKFLNLKTVNFDISFILDHQDKTCKKYKRMIKEYKIY